MEEMQNETHTFSTGKQTHKTHKLISEIYRENFNQKQTHKTHKLISVTHETHKKLMVKLIKNLGLLRAGIAKLLHWQEYSKYSLPKI
jgi:hypothetical protein